jgi:hypothetical protein
MTDLALSLSLMLRPTVSRSVYLNKTLIWGLRPDFVGLLMWGALSDEKTSLSFTSAVILGSESRGTRDHTLLSQIRDFPFSSPPMTCRATVEAFDPASTLDKI